MLARVWIVRLNKQVADCSVSRFRIEIPILFENIGNNFCNVMRLCAGIIPKWRFSRFRSGFVRRQPRLLQFLSNVWKLCLRIVIIGQNVVP